MKYMLLSALITSAIGLNAQTRKPVKKTTTVKKVVAEQQFSLKNAKDSLSYALGLDIASSLKNIPGDLDVHVLNKAIADVFENKPTGLNKENAREVIQQIITKNMSVEAEKNKAKEKAFFEKNALNPSVKSTPEGLQYEILQDASGSKPADSSEVTVNYKGMLLDGKVFDSSYDRGQPLTLTLNNVIKGWKLGIPLMSKGAKYRFYVPSELGYGPNGTGPIPPNSILIFEVELLDFK